MIETTGLCYDYENEDNKTRVLKDVNLKINESEFVAVLGHNGSGKSTLAKLFNAILIPTEGKVIVDGIDTSDEKNIFEVRKNVGMVFQNPDNQIVSTVVEDDVAFALENLSIPSEEIRLRVDEALKSVGLYEFKDSAPDKLSGGQKQRVAIAGVIALRPKYIVLDEPTAMLDPSGRREVMDILKKLNKEYKISVILITHYMEEAAAADRIIVIDDGCVLLDDTPRDIFKNVELIKSIGLDVPQTTELLYELYKEGIKVSFENLTLSECEEELVRMLEAKN